MTETVKEINRARITTAPFPSPDLGVGDNADIKYSIILCAALSRRLFYCLEVRTMGKLTPKQARFVEEYLVDLNATAAAIRAGYSCKRASEIGWQLLQKTTVQQAIQTAQTARSERTEITADYVLTNLKEIVERCMQRAPVVNRKGKQVYDDEGNAVWAFDAKNANRALELLGKHVGAFEDRHRIDLSGGIEINLSGLSEEELDTLEGLLLKTKSNSGGSGEFAGAGQSGEEAPRIC